MKKKEKLWVRCVIRLYQMLILNRLEQRFFHHISDKKICLQPDHVDQASSLSCGFSSCVPAHLLRGFYNKKNKQGRGFNDLRCWRFHLLPNWRIVWLLTHRYVEPSYVWSGACSSSAGKNQVFCSSASSFKKTMTIIVSAAFLWYCALDKAPRLSISIGIWILSSDTICQLKQLFSNSEAPMLSRREGEKSSHGSLILHKGGVQKIKMEI